MTDLEERLSNDLRAWADRTPVSDGWADHLRRVEARTASTTRRWRPAVAAAAVILIAGTATYFVNRDNSSAAPADQQAVVVESPFTADDAERCFIGRVEAFADLGTDPAGARVGAAVDDHGDFCFAWRSGGQINLTAKDNLGPEVPYFVRSGTDTTSVAAGAVTQAVTSIEFTPTGQTAPTIVVTAPVPLGELRAFAIWVDTDGQLTFATETGVVATSPVSAPLASPGDPMLQTPPVYPTNANSDTYGSNLYGTPDLIEAWGIDGTFGYLRATDMTEHQPTSPADARSDQATAPATRTIPLYAVDGVTVVGEYQIG